MALILFDFDGVLADTLDDLLRFGQEACDELGVKHVVRIEDISNLEVMSFATYGRACEVPEPLIDAFVQDCLRRFAGKKSPPGIFAGLGEVIRRLAVHHTIAVVTTNSSQNVDAFLVEHGLKGCVRAVYGTDMPGSKAQKIALARDRFSAGAGRGGVFMVGDSMSDMRAAKEASVTSIAVAWGHQSLERLLSVEPDHVVHAPCNLLDVVEEAMPNSSPKIE